MQYIIPSTLEIYTTDKRGKTSTEPFFVLNSLAPLLITKELGDEKIIQTIQATS